jgi:uncharacterized protein YeeX (DUF496 family)
MRLRPRVWLFLMVSWCAPAGLWAQNPDNTASGTAQGKNSNAAQKPVRKPDQVITNDSIGLLAVRRAPRIIPAAVAEPAGVPGEGAGADALARRAAEIASLEKEIQDRQKRIALLMKLFVDDEKEFLKNGGSAEANPVVQERRKYEQDELRWETAELAKVTARVEELKAVDRK